MTLKSKKNSLSKYNIGAGGGNDSMMKIPLMSYEKMTIDENNHEGSFDHTSQYDNIPPSILNLNTISRGNSM